MRGVEGDDPQHCVEAVEGLLIGRHADCELTVEDDYVSDLHAKIVLSGARLAITDLGSNNGTIINGEQVLHEGQTCLLESGLRIQVGHSEIAVQERSPAAMPERPVSEPPQDRTAIAGAETWDAIKSDSTRLQETVRAVSPFHGQTGQTSRPGIREAPVRRATDSTPADSDSFELRTIVAETDHPLGFATRLASMGARLVVVNEADLRIVPLDQLELSIGRSEASGLRLSNLGVSMHHARVRFHPMSNRFTVEDVGSANGTLIADSPLLEGSVRELEPDTHLRFGTIDAVFMQGLDSDLHELPADIHDGAAMLLKSRGKLSVHTIKLARKSAAEQGTNISEALLLGQFVAPREWCLAVKDARVAADIAALSGPRSRIEAGLAIALAIVAVVAIVLWVGFPAGFSSTGLGSPQP